MRFAWTRRADEERKHRIAAERRLAGVQADWPDVRLTSAALRREKEINGWTATCAAIFGTQKREGGGS